MQIIIPYAPDKQLGQAYNKAMETVKDWVLFIDHDIFLLNPEYYDACMNVIARVGHNAGWITAVTNRIACGLQLRPDAPQGDDILVHMAFAKKLWVEHGDSVEMIDINLPTPGFSGFFLLTHREAWERSGGFIDGFLGVDNNYFHALRKAEYNTYVMPGIYCYHLYRYKRLWNEY